METILYFYNFFIYSKCHCFLEIFIMMFDMKIALCMKHLHILYLFLEISCTTLMGRQASFQYSWRLGSTASYLHQMRPFRKPCQRCWTALIQLRFTLKQDLMCSTVSWLERTEKTLGILRSLFTIPQAKALTRFSDIEDFPPNDFFTIPKLLLRCIFKCTYKIAFCTFNIFLYLHLWICKSKLLK